MIIYFIKNNCTSSNDDSFGKEDVHSEEDDDDFYDDGSHCNLFMDEVNEIQGGGGWIQNDVGDSKDISSPQSSKSDNIQNENFTRLILENSNIHTTPKSRRSVAKNFGKECGKIFVRNQWEITVGKYVAKIVGKTCGKSVGKFS
ncbi:hypothetical protein Tco_1079689 [Tanacetum coccineum]|uniref:Uncharacterized protein n=1 Tax=Tanacetum coccineum TaxID=301880 RepID=A0ABQ5HTH3_9ASTR